jgi:hypothetical protein
VVEPTSAEVVVEPVVGVPVVAEGAGVHPQTTSATTARRRGRDLTRQGYRGRHQRLRRVNPPGESLVIALRARPARTYMAKRASKRSALAMICAGSSMSFS